MPTSWHPKHYCEKVVKSTYLGMRFIDPALEKRFLAEERERSYRRYWAASVIFAVVALGYVVITPSTERQWLPSVVVLTITVIGTCCDVAILFVIWQRIAAAAAAAAKSNNSNSSLNCRVVVELPADDSCSSTSSEAGAGEDLTTSDLHTMDRIHEILVGITHFSLVVCVCWVYTAVQHTCTYVHHHHGDMEDNVDCPYRFYPFWSLSLTLYPLIVSQPRFFIVCWTNAISFLLLPVLISFHNTSPAVTALIFVFCAAFTVFSCVLKYFEESKHRTRFSAQILLQNRRQEAVDKTASLREFLLSITPKHLHSRLKNATTTVSVDNSDDAVCLVVHTRNITKFMFDYLPTKASKYLAMFGHNLEMLGDYYGFHQMRSLGDTITLVSNLFNTDHSTTEEAVSACVQVAVNIELPSSDGPNPLEVCCGAASGQLMGLPLGTTCIRYDIFGDALQEAHVLALSAPPGPFVSVSSSISTLLSERLLLSADTVCSIGTTLVVGVAELTAPVSAGGVVIPPPNNGHFLTNPLLSLGPSTTTPSTPSGHRSSSGLDFDVLEHIGMVVSGSNESGSGNGGSSSVSTAAAPKMIRTSVPVHRTKNWRKNLDIWEGCCFCASFVDQQVADDAKIEHRRTSAVSFAVTCIFCAVLVVLVLAMGVVEGSYSSTTPKTSSRFLGGIVAFSVDAVLLVVVGLHVSVAGAPLQAAHQFVAVFCFVLSLVASALMRPTIAGEANGVLLFTFSLAALFIGLSLRLQMLFLVVITTLATVIEIVVVPRLPRLLAVYPCSSLFFFIAALVSNKFGLQLYRATVEAQEALEEVTMHENIRVAISAALIPHQLAHLITPESLASHSIDCWGIDDCIAVVLNVSHVSEFASSVAKVASLQHSIDTRMAIVEKAVGNCPNQMIAITKVFGGSVMIAGPLVDADRSLDHSGAVKATSDAVHLMKELLSGNIAAEEKVSTNNNNYSHINDDENRLQFTAGISIEQGIPVLVTSDYPHFDLMGPCVNTSRMLVAAAPAEMVVATDKFTNLYERECPAVDGVVLHDAETWRLRDLGKIRVQRLSVA